MNCPRTRECTVTSLTFPAGNARCCRGPERWHHGAEQLTTQFHYSMPSIPRYVKLDRDQRHRSVLQSAPSGTEPRLLPAREASPAKGAGADQLLSRAGSTLVRHTQGLAHTLGEFTEGIEAELLPQSWSSACSTLCITHLFCVTSLRQAPGSLLFRTLGSTV